jgi:outer membrane cobalamin receptor
MPFSQTVWAQTDSLPKPEVDFFLNRSKIKSDPNRVSVAGFSSQTLRETPGVVSLITEEDIKAMGVRDLQEIMRLIPGFDVALDVKPILTFRGNATNEAKMLITIDGIPINDNSFGFNYLMNRFPLVNIERIEIIRGPGSAVYGGLAGLGVINIITKSQPNSKIDVQTQAFLGAAHTGYMRHNFGFYSNFRPNEKVEISLSAASMNQQDSNVDFDAFSIVRGRVSNQYNFVRSNYLNASLRIKNITFRYIHNSFSHRLPHIGDAILTHQSHLVNLQYQANLSEKVSVNAKVGLRYIEPFLFNNVPSIGGIRLDVLDFSAVNENRLIANSYLLYRPNKKFTFVIGAETLGDRSRYILQNLYYKDSTRSASFMGFSVFGEAALYSKIVNLTLGGRFERYADVEPIGVPRVALTKVFKKMHFKLIYNQAFKTPTILNIKNAKTGKILPERFVQYEAEVGWRFSERTFFTLNAYDLAIRDYILRRDNVTIDADFDNVGNSRTRGVELEAGFKGRVFQAKGSFSYYSSLEILSNQFVPGLSHANAGIPAQKVAGFLSLNPSQNIKLSLNGFVLSNKFGFSPFIQTPKEYQPEIHLNFYSNFRHIFTRNLELGIGVHNLLDGKFWYATWKVDANGSVEMPYQSREFFVKMTYSFQN